MAALSWLPPQQADTRNALAFEVDAEAKLLALQHELRDHAYRAGRSICFVTGGPKPREVFAADFRDRIVRQSVPARTAARLQSDQLGPPAEPLPFLRRVDEEVGVRPPRSTWRARRASTIGSIS